MTSKRRKSPPTKIGPVAAGPDQASSAVARRFGMACLACLTIAFWMIIHPYRGLEHDSVLYAVLALARLHPAALGHDLFVRYGTQDNFTIFSPMFAWAIRHVGLEPAAAIMTFITHVAFFGAAWLFARRLMPPSLALLAVGLLVVLPSWYGSHSVFAYTEAFLTPRQGAEAFALGGLAAALYSRQLLAGSCMAVAMLLHPIIAAAGIMAWIVLVPGLKRPRLGIAIVGIVAILLVTLSAIGVGPFKHFDTKWLTVLQDRLAYLFPTEWSATEWVNTEVHAAVLVVGIRFSSTLEVRRLCIAVLVTATLGMLFAMVESDGLHVIIAGQLQTWRWLWLLGATSVLLLPVLAIDCWHSGDLGRAAALFMLGALLARADAIAALPATLACLVALGATTVRERSQARTLFVAAIAVLALCVAVVAHDVYKLLPQLDTIRSQHLTYMVRMGEAQALAYGGLLPAGVLAVLCFSLSRLTRRNAILLAGLGAVLLVSILPYSVLTWTHIKYPQDRMQAFAPWRAAIPESAEILWPDPPSAEWFELGRANYWSLYQMAGMVFSRDVTMVSTRRESAVTPLLPDLGRTLSTERHYASAPKMKDVPPPEVGAVCKLPGVTFYASWADLGPTPYPAVAPDLANPHDLLYLYRCDPEPH